MNPGRALVGTLVAGVGLAFLLGSLGVLDAGETIRQWWPIGIVALGLVHLPGSRGPRGGGVALVVAGLVLLGVTTGRFGSDAWAYVWPSALIAVGLWILLGWGRRYGIRPNDDERVDGIAVFGSARLATRSQSFRSASLTSVLGGITLDLTEARPVAGGGEITVTALLGGVTILVPRGWVVEIRGIPLLGGWDDTTDRSGIGPDAPRLEVQALVALGGVEVKHGVRW